VPTSLSVLVGVVSRGRAGARWSRLVLVRSAFLGVANVFALVRLLPVSDRDKDVEIPALRHQLALLQRQLGERRVRFEPADRALLAALLHQLSRPALRGLPLLVRPTLSCAGSATCNGATTPRCRVRAAGHPRRARFGSWCCGWPGRTPAGAIGGSTANCWC
jgi:hypothetical protein